MKITSILFAGVLIAAPVHAEQKCAANRCTDDIAIAAMTVADARYPHKPREALEACANTVSRMTRYIRPNVHDGALVLCVVIAQQLHLTDFFNK